jgi:hypothetical protein
METPNVCVDCGVIEAAPRCTSCQRRHNDRLQAEHRLMVRALFRAADGHSFGSQRRSRHPARRSEQLS